MKVRLVALTLILTLLGLSIGPLAASAATSPDGAALSGPATTQLVHSPFDSIQTTGAVHATTVGTTADSSSAASGTFSGRVTIMRFAVQDGRLVALVSVKGTVTTTSGTQTVSAEATTAAQASGTCTILNLHLAPLHLNLLGLVVDTSNIYLTITGQTGSGQLLGNLLCALSGLFNTPGPLANLLNTLLAGIAATLATVNTHFVTSGGSLYAVTTLNGKVVGVAPAQASGTCSVLNLKLGPLHLNLLGLIVDLNGGVDSTTGTTLPVTVTITGQQGTLLGGLVCAIANLLNGNPPNLSKAAGLLNVLFGLLRL